MFKYSTTALLLTAIQLLSYTLGKRNHIKSAILLILPTFTRYIRKTNIYSFAYEGQGCSTNPCGLNAICRESYGRPRCTCAPGCVGDPSTSCRLVVHDEPCIPSPCGPNATCVVTNDLTTCSCLPGFVGSGFYGCRHECDNDYDCEDSQMCLNFKCTTACTLCGTKALCLRLRNHRAVCECPEGYIGSPFTECRLECYGNEDCPASRPACVYGTCKNPCDRACGVNAKCDLRGLTPTCSCPKTHTGNPFISCRPYTKETLCITEDCDNSPCVGYSCANPCLEKCRTGTGCNIRRYLGCMAEKN